MFHETNPVLKLVGIDKFSGYEGYMYLNGLVAFEIYYTKNEPNKPKTIAQSGATYLMNYKNFEELSKKTKTEIIERIKNSDDPDVRRIPHKEKWAEHLNEALNSVQISQEESMKVVALINALNMNSNNIKQTIKDTIQGNSK